MLFRLIHIVAFVLFAVSSAHSQSVTATDDSTRVAEIIYNVTHTFDGSSISLSSRSFLMFSGDGS